MPDVLSIAIAFTGSFALIAATAFAANRLGRAKWRPGAVSEDWSMRDAEWDDADEELAAAAREMAEAETVEMEAVR